MFSILKYFYFSKEVVLKLLHTSNLHGVFVKMWHVGPQVQTFIFTMSEGQEDLHF